MLNGDRKSHAPDENTNGHAISSKAGLPSPVTHSKHMRKRKQKEHAPPSLNNQTVSAHHHSPTQPGNKTSPTSKVSTSVAPFVSLTTTTAPDLSTLSLGNEEGVEGERSSPGSSIPPQSVSAAHHSQTNEPNPSSLVSIGPAPSTSFSQYPISKNLQPPTDTPSEDFSSTSTLPYLTNSTITTTSTSDNSSDSDSKHSPSSSPLPPSLSTSPTQATAGVPYYSKPPYQQQQQQQQLMYTYAPNGNFGYPHPPPPQYLLQFAEDGTPLYVPSLSQLSCELEQEVTFEIMDLVQSISPSAKDLERRETFIAKIEKILADEYPELGVKVHTFGSTITGLATVDSDVDLCVTAEGWEDPVEAIQDLAECMRRYGMREIYTVTKAKVPICKFWDPEYGLNCDINVNNRIALRNTLLIKTYVSLDPRVRPILMTIKHWTKQRVLNDAAKGGTLSTYCWVCMAINYLQLLQPPVLPSLHAPYLAQLTRLRDPSLPPLPASEIIPTVVIDGTDTSFLGDLSHPSLQTPNWPPNPPNRQTLGALLHGFFQFYTFRFPYTTHVASPRLGTLLLKPSKGWNPHDPFSTLCVEDPVCESRNLGNSADGVSVRGLRGEIWRALRILEGGGGLEGGVCEAFVARRGGGHQGQQNGGVMMHGRSRSGPVGGWGGWGGGGGGYVYEKPLQNGMLNGLHVSRGFNRGGVLPMWAHTGGDSVSDVQASVLPASKPLLEAYGGVQTAEPARDDDGLVDWVPGSVQAGVIGSELHLDTVPADLGRVSGDSMMPEPGVDAAGGLGSLRELLGGRSPVPPYTGTQYYQNHGNSNTGKHHKSHHRRSQPSPPHPSSPPSTPSIPFTNGIDHQHTKHQNHRRRRAHSQIVFSDSSPQPSASTLLLNAPEVERPPRVRSRGSSPHPSSESMHNNNIYGGVVMQRLGASNSRLHKSPSPSPSSERLGTPPLAPLTRSRSTSSRSPQPSSPLPVPPSRTRSNSSLSPPPNTSTMGNGRRSSWVPPGRVDYVFDPVLGAYTEVEPSV
ncbi:hypothetical protein HDV05_007200 [Chytridiales sp. JEL 0842]|nr:hypothetical protein HDV05_007200 [Chytridiales sp. JEL 0842]